MSFALGVDVGSQSVKGVLLDQAGRVRAGASAPLSITHPAPAWAEQDPHSWESALEAVVGKLLHDARLTAGRRRRCWAWPARSTASSPSTPRASRSGRRSSGWTAGPRPRPTGCASRSGPSGCTPSPAWWPTPRTPGPRSPGSASDRPEVFAAAVAFPPVAGYLVQRLTGRLVIDHANASSSLLYDVTERRWSAPLLRRRRASSRDQLGEIAESGDVAGPLTAEAAERLGLTTGCLVLVGTGDDHAGAVGAGVVRPGPGRRRDRHGRAGRHLLAAARCSTTRPCSRRTRTPRPASTWSRTPASSPAAASCGSPARSWTSPRPRCWPWPRRAQPGADGVLFLPALSGSMAPRWNGAMRGAFAGLSMATTKASMARAIVEGCCFALRDITDRFAALGLDATEIRVVGGGARSREWLQAKADVTGRPVRAVQVEEATALGAALLAAVACGTFADLDEAVKTCVVTADEPIRAAGRDRRGLRRRLRPLPRALRRRRGSAGVTSASVVDVDDLDPIRELVAAADPAEQLRAVGLREVVSGATALATLPAAAERPGGGRRRRPWLS